MSTIVTRAGKGSPLTHNEVDANFNNLNNDKYQSGDSPTFVTVNATTVDATNLEVTNVKAKDGTAALSIADSTGKVTVSTELAVDNINVSGNAITSTNANGNIDLTPNGTGEVNITKADIDSGTIDGTTIGGSSAAAGTFTSLTNSGNLTFSSTGQRITGDMANATLTNRLAFQNSVTNANTPVNAIPNGTGTGAGFRGYGASDPTNAPSVSVFQIGTTDSRIASEINGTASYTPLTFYTGGSERMRLDTSGRLCVATTTGRTPLSVSQFSNGTPSLGSTNFYSGSFMDTFASYGLGVHVSSATGISVLQSQRFDGTATAYDIALNPYGGNVGIGTASPVTRLHVLDALSGGQLIVANSETNAVEKYGTFATQHYTNAEEPALGMAVQSNSTDNNILIGGALGEFNAATTVRFYTAANNTTTTGTERMRIDSSGVGIGTASPQRPLQVNNAVSDNCILATSGAANAYIGFADSGTTSQTGLSVRMGSSGNGMIFQTGGTTTRMTIDSSGNVGIGGTPTAFFNTIKTTAGNATDAIWRHTFDVNWGITLQQQHVSGSHIQWNWVDTAGNNLLSWNRGNVGIGTTSPVGRLHVNNSGSAETNPLIISNNISGIAIATAGAQFVAHGVEFARIVGGQNQDNTFADGNLRFFTRSAETVAERMRITPGGDALVGCTTSPSSTVVGVRLGKTATQGFGMSAAGGTGSLEHWYYYNPNGLVGTITTSGSATAYNTSSDRRLKENIAPADDAGALVDAIQIVKHDWKVGGHTRYGAVAQDLYEVVPEAVAKGDDGDEIEKTWGVDYSKLVPILVKEIQSLRARVAALEAK